MIPLIFLAGLLNLGLGIYVLAKNPRKLLNRLFGVLAFAITLWVLSNIWLFTNVRANYPYLHVSYAFGALIPPIVLHWVSSFIRKKISRFYLLLSYCLSIIVALFSLVPGVLIKKITEVDTYSMKADFGVLFFPYAFIVSTTLLLSAILLIKERAATIGLRRLQMNYVCLGFGIPIVLIIIVDFIFPVLGNTKYYNFDSLTSFFFVGILTYSITRYRFLDIKFVLRKGFIYATSLMIALAFYAYVVIVGKQYLQTSIHLSESWGIFLLVALIAIGFPPLRKGVELLINAIFETRQDADSVLEELRGHLSSTKDLSALLQAITVRLKDFLDIQDVRILLADQREKAFIGPLKLEFSNPLVRYLRDFGEIIIAEELSYMIDADTRLEKKEFNSIERLLQEINVAAVVPIGKGEELIGIFLIGKKQSGAAFTLGDIQFLKQLSLQSIISLGNAVLYRDAIERIKSNANKT